jgi:hypothetical protein
LLVEAVVSAVVIAVGLVFISRTLGSHLKVVRLLERRQAASALQAGKFIELETAAMVRETPPDARGMSFDEPYAGSGAGWSWTATAVLLPEDTDEEEAQRVPTSRVTLAVKAAGGAEGSALTDAHSVVWPREFVELSWYE